jgi:dTDP-4-amino-4,6-dideoxygalactose transaminase
MIPFAPPRIDEQTIEAVTEVLRSGWITTGPKVKEFEEKLAAYVGVEHVKCVSSATAGLELMLRWFGIGPGDEVIVPAYTYCATANVVLHCGAKPVMVDVGPDLNMSVTKVAEAISDKTKGIVPVDIAGLPCHMDELFELIESKRDLFNPTNDIQRQLGRVLLMSDAAHSLGATYDGKRTGSIADVTIFSFHAVKNLTTAEGGAICLNLNSSFELDKLHKELSIKVLHGQTKDALAKSKGSGWEYDVVEAGYKANMTDILAAIGLVELERYESENLPRRKEIFQNYTAGFSQYDWAELPVMKDDIRETAYHVFPLRIKGVSIDQRNEMIDRIVAAGVSVNVHFKPLPLLTLYRDLGYNIEDYPNAKDSFERVMTLPVYFQMTDDQVETVIRTVSEQVESVLNS